MAKTVIAEEVVKFTVDGLVESQRKTMTTIDNVTKATTKGNAAIKNSFGSVQAMAAKAAVIGMVFKGFQGTRELDQLGASLTYLARVMANEAAPIIRGVTVAVMVFTDQIRALPGEVKGVIVAIGALIGIFMIFGTGPVGIIVAGITAISAALIYLSEDADWMAGKLEPVFAWFLRQWYRLTYAAKRAANEIAGVFVKVVQIGENLINGDDWDKDLDILNKAIEEQNQELADAFKKNMEAAPDQAKRAARATADALKGVRDLLGGAWDQLKAPGGLHMKVSVELETPANTWDRIQKAFAEGKNDINPQLDGHLGAIRGQLNQQLNEMKKKIGMGQ